MGGGNGSNGGLTRDTELYDPATGNWSLSGATVVAPFAPMLTLLDNAKVLMVASNGAELYNPATGTWAVTSAPTGSFSEPNVTLLPSGKVLLTGIDNGGSMVAQTYNSATGTWAAAPSPTLARISATATLLQDGNVLLSGGVHPNNFIEVIPTEIYFAAAGAVTPMPWTFTISAMPQRQNSRAALLPDGRVLTVGGQVSAKAPADVIDPVTLTATPTGAMNRERTEHTLTPLLTGKYLAAGGFSLTAERSAELYDTATNGWAGTGLLNTARARHTATLLWDGKVLAAGGMANSTAALASCELYDPVTGGWTSSGALATSRMFHTATLLANGKVLVVGGQSSTGPLSSAELYDPFTQRWVATGSLQTARTAHTATLLPDGRVLVTGGSDVDFLSSVEIYDPATGAWTLGGGMRFARAGHTATMLPDGRILLAGGDAGRVELYEPVSGQTRSLANLSDGRIRHTATLLPNGKVLILAGANGALFSGDLYDPLPVADALRPLVNAINPSANSESRLTFSGTQLQGPWEASGGLGGANSAANFPTASVMSLTNERLSLFTLGEGETFSDTNFRTGVIGTFPPGPVLAWVIKNSVPSHGRRLNYDAPPSLHLGAAFSRLQGAPQVNVVLALLQDGEQAVNTLILELTRNSGAGVTLTNLAVTAEGRLTADLNVACDAVNSSFKLTVKDVTGQSVATNFNVTVLANSAPVLSYTDRVVAAGSTLTVNPTTGPSDNQSVASVRVLSVTPPLSNTPTVNAAGVVAFGQLRPAGNHVVTVRAEDNCGVFTDASFNVNATCTTITATLGGSRVCQSEPATVTVNVTGGTAPYTVTLSNGGGTRTGNSPLVFNVTPDVTYGLQTGTDANGCAIVSADSAVAASNGSVFVTQPVSRSPSSRSPATFSVTTNAVNLTYQWRKDGVNLTDNSRISGATTARLTINGLTLADAGSYTVLASNSCFSELSTAAALPCRMPRPWQVSAAS